MQFPDTKSDAQVRAIGAPAVHLLCSQPIASIRSRIATFCSRYGTGSQREREHGQKEQLIGLIKA
ncbi:hypothetical protein TS85_22075 [Sphingomonas hengshuiensis]|uniref:Uncharacterized protein n=1 Tax=Sphingomonas hengshuiensis TaxID=1609977 RepID=A0A7U4JBS9_9SPHN|nr:hypothetical protein TS85_22075 [Sphingomonas hengshuiensis]